MHMLLLAERVVSAPPSTTCRKPFLSTIAAANGVGGGWQALVAKNPALAGNPDSIFPGQRLTI